VARITRKDLKTDKFALEVEQTVDFFEEHRKDVIRYGSIALVVVLIGVAIFFYRKQQHTARQEALGHAIQVQEAAVGQQSQGGALTFPTQQAKDEAATKAFNDVIAKHGGSEEALVAEYYLGAIAADQGKLPEATKHFQKVVDSGDDHYGPLAKLSLAQIYFSDGHPAEAEKLLRSLIDHPSLFVSKDQATLALVQGLAKSKPEEARKLLAPLRTNPGTVSQVAIRLYGELFPN
jgi:predicted negative regulator of RcsB-dependent stress response